MEILEGRRRPLLGEHSLVTIMAYLYEVYNLLCSLVSRVHMWFTVVVHDGGRVGPDIVLVTQWIVNGAIHRAKVDVRSQSSSFS